MADYTIMNKKGELSNISFDYWHNQQNSPYALFFDNRNSNKEDISIAISLQDFLNNNYPDNIQIKAIIVDADCDNSQLDKAILNINTLIAYVTDFKDGRIFSVIRHIRHLGYMGNIYVAGSFGLDQANYFIKSGANGFMISNDKIQILKKTICDLQTGHLGDSAGELPIFR